MKAFAKKLLRAVGVEAHSYIPGSSRSAQLMATLQHFGIADVLDVGANTGQFALELFELGYRGRIVSVEPIPDAHAVLVSAAGEHPNWTAHDATAVGAEMGEVSFQVSANLVSSSVLTVKESSVEAAPASRQLRSITVPVTTVDQLVAQHGFGRAPSLLKVDTQGYEGHVLTGAKASLASFDLVLLELSLIELYSGQSLWLELIGRMQSAGFELWFIQPEFVQPSTGQTLQVNGLFRRSR